MSPRTHVVVAGGGVAALETCMALRAVAGDRMLVTLIAPNAYFEYRPIAVHDPLARIQARVPIAQLARAAGADLRRDRLVGVDPARQRLHTASGFELSYDALVVAVGAQPLAVPQGAVAFDHGVHVVESAYVREIGDGELDLVPGPRRLRADWVIAAPRLGGPRPSHVPCDADGFIVVDRSGRVPGIDGVFAAGDCTAFPVKHASLAAQQADAVASAIAGVAPEPFTPVLRGILPARLRWYLQAPLTGGLGDATEVSAHPLWPGDARFHARHLIRELAELEDCEGAARHDDQPLHDGHRPPAAMAAH